MNPQTHTDPHPATANDQDIDNKASFAETALKMGGKSDDEARRTGAIDKADDQVEQLFAKRFQTVNSPVPRPYGTASCRSSCSRAARRQRLPRWKK